ncbi:MAG TPA: hypothetical protein VFB72_17250 [Verrucomicrobiae bacterium]|nr:hypothetical protein [Verrucomicrobiae bacterium]
MAVLQGGIRLRWGEYLLEPCQTKPPAGVVFGEKKPCRLRAFVKKISHFARACHQLRASSKALASKINAAGAADSLSGTALAEVSLVRAKPNPHQRR